MVKGHQAVLNAINEKLLLNVSNPDLKAALTETRTTVMQHLQMTETLQKQLAH